MRGREGRDVHALGCGGAAAAGLDVAAVSAVIGAMIQQGPAGTRLRRLRYQRLYTDTDTDTPDADARMAEVAHQLNLLQLAREGRNIPCCGFCGEEAGPPRLGEAIDVGWTLVEQVRACTQRGRW